MPNVIMLSASMLSVVMLSVVSPSLNHAIVFIQYKPDGSSNPEFKLLRLSTRDNFFQESKTIYLFKLV
jgi:hypothetical protein